jgi:hypothetical protein
MNIVELLENAVNRLPAGEYSTGVNAIVRHVKAAIRHLERDQEHDPDTCTDAIYRMNQAYEGSLKEAYRVLAGKDPSGLSPFQIEGYLESHSVVRPRVLTQLTRYRQDYRNPSTHDYKLDFDEDEALLAIVSVCAFAKLLINQISSKLASEVAQAKVSSRSMRSSRASLRSLAKTIGEIALAYTNESGEVDAFEYERGLTDILKSAGFDAVWEHDDDEISPIWDIVVRKGKSHLGIDIRASRSIRRTTDLVEGSQFEVCFTQNSSAGLLIIRSSASAIYYLYRGEADGKPVYVICEDDAEQLKYLQSDLGVLHKLG